MTTTTLTPDVRIAFIGGLQRSGTTLLGRLIAAHPDAAGLVGTHTPEDEGQFVQDVVIDDHRMAKEQAGWIGGISHWAFHPAAHMDEADAKRIPDAAARMLAGWQPYWSRPEAELYVEKSPSNLGRMRFLQEAFPRSTSIVISRHPVTQALATRKWTHPAARIGLDFEQLIDHWCVAMEMFEADQPHLRESLLVKYEDLIAKPDATMSAVGAFLGLRDVGFDVSDVSDRDGVYRRYWSAMRGQGERLVPLNPKGGAHREVARILERLIVPTIGRRRLARTIERYEPRIARFGYSFEDLA
ncbi:sulfotransferase family protein [Microbacterium lacusdiani]